MKIFVNARWRQANAAISIAETGHPPALIAMTLPSATRSGLRSRCTCTRTKTQRNKRLSVKARTLVKRKNDTATNRCSYVHLKNKLPVVFFLRSSCLVPCVWEHQSHDSWIHHSPASRCYLVGGNQSLKILESAQLGRGWFWCVRGEPNAQSIVWPLHTTGSQIDVLSKHVEFSPNEVAERWRSWHD